MSYSVRVPETPSASLNSWLKTHYATSSNRVQFVVGTVVCRFYELTTLLHLRILNARGNLDSKTMWMAACGLVGVTVTIAAWLLFTLIMATSFIIHGMLLYAAIITGIIGLGLGAAGALYFSKDMEPAKHGEGGSGEYHHHSTVTTSWEHSRSHDE